MSTKARGRKGKAAAVPLAVFNGAAPNPAATKGPKAGSKGSQQQPQQAQQQGEQVQQRAPGSSAAAAAAALWRQPLIPSCLNDVVRKFSPEYAAQAAAQAVSAPATTQRPTIKAGELFLAITTH